MVGMGASLKDEYPNNQNIHWKRRAMKLRETFDHDKRRVFGYVLVVRL